MGIVRPSVRVECPSGGSWKYLPLEGWQEVVAVWGTCCLSNFPWVRNRWWESEGISVEGSGYSPWLPAWGSSELTALPGRLRSVLFRSERLRWEGRWGVALRRQVQAGLKLKWKWKSPPHPQKGPRKFGGDDKRSFVGRVRASFSHN